MDCLVGEEIQNSTYSILLSFSASYACIVKSLPTFDLDIDKIVQLETNVIVSAAFRLKKNTVNTYSIVFEFDYYFCSKLSIVYRCHSMHNSSYNKPKFI